MRNVSDIDHDYYNLIDSVMTFLLSFCEGGKAEILENISEIILASQIYERMQTLVRLLFQRTRKMFQVEKEKLIQELRALPFSDMIAYLEQREVEAMAIEEVNKRMADVVKIKSVKQLKDIYIRNANFSGHHCLKIAAKIYFLMQNISASSELYKKFLDETKASIKKKKKIFLFKKEIELRQDQMIHLFICKVTSAVEIVNKDNKLIISRFLKAPSSFFLTLSSKEEFFEASNMESIISFKEQFMKNMQSFRIEMTDGLSKNKKSKYLNKLTDKDS